MKLAIFMSTWLGRSLRIVPGLILITLAFVQSNLWWLAIIGSLLVLSGVLNICLLSKLFGGPVVVKKSK